MEPNQEDPPGPPPGPIDPTKPLPAPFAGFYANLNGVSEATAIVFLVEFSLLLLLAIFMYGFYLRERNLKSKIKFTKSGYVYNGGSLGNLHSRSEVGGQRNNNRLSFL